MNNLEQELKNTKERSLFQIFVELSQYHPLKSTKSLTLEYYTLRQDMQMEHYAAIGQLYAKYMPNYTKE